VGRIVLQLCKLLKLRAVAALRGKPTSSSSTEDAGVPCRNDAWFERVAEQLQHLGATIVLRDEGSLKVCLQG
jgi:hypothetical protein